MDIYKHHWFVIISESCPSLFVLLLVTQKLLFRRLMPFWRQFGSQVFVTSLLDTTKIQQRTQELFKETAWVIHFYQIFIEACPVLGPVSMVRMSQWIRCPADLKGIISQTINQHTNQPTQSDGDRHCKDWMWQWLWGSLRLGAWLRSF